MRRRRRHGIGQSISNHGEYQPLVATWMLRMLLTHHWVFTGFFTKKDGYRDADVAEFFQLPEFEDGQQPTIIELKKSLKKQLHKFEDQIDDSLVLFENIRLFSKRVELSTLQQEIVAFASLVESSSAWSDLFRNVKVETEQQFIQLLSCMLDASVPDIKTALSRKSFLCQSGMISVEKRDYEDGKIGIMDELQQALLAANENEEALLSHFLKQSKSSTLTLDDYPHAEQDIEVTQNILKEAIIQGDKGVNILLYGTPGTGKTELVRLLADELKLTLFEVKTEDDDGDAIRPDNRLGSYRLSQQLLSQDSKSLVLFDEVEDVFPTRSFSFFGMEVKSSGNKGWMNKALEENKTPAVWVSNQVEQIDPAFLRRFDYVMELNTPPKPVRLKIINSYLGDKPVSSGFIERLAEHERLSPAQIEKVSKVATRIAHGDENLDAVLEQVVENSLKAMSLKPLSKAKQHATHYDLNYLNANMDIPKLVEGLKRVQKGNICFYGAPGTGKTALAGYIAKAMDKPLLSKRASDILGMYVGQSEQNIAAMFAQAKREKAVLVLDEADSLLRDRRGAKQSWEVSQVNELLVQMENFDGLFICSTNLMDDLDQASLRRFAVKVSFDYLTHEQACLMLEKECVGELSSQDKRALSLMTNLAPGDFAAVNKRLEILDVEATSNALLKELKEEVSIKSGTQSKSIGFLS